MRFKADLLLEKHLGGRLEALARLLLLFTEKFLDRVTHEFGFGRGFGVGLHPKPGVPAWGIANVFHASSQFPATIWGSRNRPGRCRIIGTGPRPGKVGRNPCLLI